jgi:AI-2 transport protein TqsA
MQTRPDRAEHVEHRALLTFGVLVIAAFATGAGLHALKNVALPFVLAMLLAYIVTPVVDFVEVRLRWPRILGLLLVLLLSTGALAGVVVLIVSSISGLEGNLDVYETRLLQFATNLTAWLGEQGLDLDPASIRTELESLPLRTWATSAIGSVADILSKGVLTLLFFVFIVVGRSPWLTKGGVWEGIDRSVNRYLRVKLFTSGVVATLSGLTLAGFGVDLALVFAILTFILNFIPTIGSIIAVGLTLPLIFVALDPLTGAGVVACLLVIQNGIGNVLEPRIMGRGLDLHPATILLGLGLWGLIWGVVGMLLSAPLMAILRIVLHRYAFTRPMAELLSGRVGEQARTQPEPEVPPEPVEAPGDDERPVG